MIAVIADDLSGATELAGIAARLGLRSEVHTVFDPRSDAEVIAVDTGTRSRSATEAARITGEVAAAVGAAHPEWFYKKTDSVLRGHVLAEVEAVRRVTGHRRVLYLPANPSRQRTIRGGIYCIAGVPLDQSSFSQDPEHPRRSAVVSVLLGLGPEISWWQVPDVALAGDLATCARNVPPDTLTAGAADFFEALLKARCVGREPACGSLHPAGRTLLVCGSAAAWDQGRAQECQRRGMEVVVMPEQLFSGIHDGPALAKWSHDATGLLARGSDLMIAIGRPATRVSPLAPGALVRRLAETAALLCSTQPVARILLEGGATAAAFLDRAGWTRLRAVPAAVPGVGVLEPGRGPLLLVKPGSYSWPDTVWV
jgi:uncharacterized protein YgbK (DUF1537 family)